MAKKEQFTDEEIKAIADILRQKWVKPAAWGEAVDTLSEELKDPDNEACFFFSAKVKDGLADFSQQRFVDGIDVEEILDVLDFLIMKIQNTKLEVMLKALKIT